MEQKTAKEFLYTDFNSIGFVANSMLQAPNLRQGMKKSTVFKFWDKVVGKKFEKYSKIESLNSDNVLIVACANASVTSELTMFKNDILKKFNSYAVPLGIEVVDIKFSHKIWKVDESEYNEILQEEKNPYKPDLSGFNPDDIMLDEQEVNAILNSVMQNKFASQEQRQKMFDAIILNLKIQKYVNNNAKML